MGLPKPAIFERMLAGVFFSCLISLNLAKRHKYFFKSTTLGIYISHYVVICVEKAIALFEI